MALDNAQFISELSISDPPGTDPLSEGDDQIRTAKRAVFQSFEFVDKAVTKTADEFNDMAQRSGGNVFTGNQQFNTQARFSDGTELLPSIAFTQDLDMGLYRIGAAQLGIATAGVERLRITASQARFNPPLLASDGIVTAPAYSFTSETNMGMFRNQAGVLGFGVGNEEVFRMALSNVRTGPNTVIRTGGDGSAATPAFGFQLQTNMGMFRGGSSLLRFATGGVTRLSLTTSISEFTNGLVSVAKAGATSVAGFHIRDASAVPRWQFQILTDANGNDLGLRRLNSSGVSQGDWLRIKQSDGHWIIDRASWPTADTGTSGELFLSGGQFLAASA